MKIRFIALSVLILGACFAAPHTVFAIACGTGGTCKASCSSGTETESAFGKNFCESTPSTSKCCIAINTICLSPGICQSGPTASRPNLNPDPNINCGATDRCYVPAPSNPAPIVKPPNPAPIVIPQNPAPIVNPGSNTTLINPLKSGNCNSENTDCLGAFLNSILDLVIRIGTVIVILMLVFVGFKFVTAQGEPGKITEARGMLLWTVVGALILLGAKAIQEGITATVKALGG